MRGNNAPTFDLGMKMQALLSSYCLESRGGEGGREMYVASSFPSHTLTHTHTHLNTHT